MKILILFAHPAFHKSRINRILIEGLQEKNNVTFHDLYESYPDFNINIKREQELLLQHDCVIFHHPFFWYSVPAILKEWQDLVLQHGWAYGSKGIALKDKIFFSVLTTGGPKQAYVKESFHNHTILELIAPILQSFRLCKMIILPPFVVHGTHAMENEQINSHKKNYFKLLEHIIADELDVNNALEHSYLNDYLELKEK